MKLRENKGITLIALIITIIILLILAVVTIMAVNGDGIIGKAKQAKAEYQNAQAEEQNILDKYLAEMEGLEGNNTLPEEENPENDNNEEPPDNSDNNEETKESYVGYYADVNADGTVDGVIYADLAVGNTGDGEWGTTR